MTAARYLLDPHLKFVHHLKCTHRSAGCQSTCTIIIRTSSVVARGGQGDAGDWGSAPNPAGAPPQTPLGLRPKLRWTPPQTPFMSGSGGGSPHSRVWGGAPAVFGALSPAPCVHDTAKPAGLVRHESPNLSESSFGRLAESANEACAATKLGLRNPGS